MSARDRKNKLLEIRKKSWILTVNSEEIYEFVRNLKMQILIFKDLEVILVYIICTYIFIKLLKSKICTKSIKSINIFQNSEQIHNLVQIKE